MRARATVPIVAALAVLAVVAPSAGKPTESQTFFENALAADAGVTASIKSLLATDAGVVDPTSGLADVTGDGRDDALVFVATKGAAGRVGFYVFSSHGQSGTSNADLKLIYRNQSLYNATVRLAGTTITLVEPKYSKGDDLGTPARTVERDYAWDGGTFVKRATRTLRS